MPGPGWVVSVPGGEGVPGLGGGSAPGGCLVGEGSAPGVGVPGGSASDPPL